MRAVVQISGRRRRRGNEVGRGETYLALALIPVDVGEVVLWEFESDGEEDVEGVEDLSVQGLAAG